MIISFNFKMVFFVEAQKDHLVVQEYGDLLCFFHFSDSLSGVALVYKYFRNFFNACIFLSQMSPI